MIILFIVLLSIGFWIAVFLAFGVVLAQKRAIKQGVAMIDSGMADKTKARKILKTLSSCNTNEGRKVYNKLSELIERQAF